MIFLNGIFGRLHATCWFVVVHATVNVFRFTEAFDFMEYQGADIHLSYVVFLFGVMHYID